MLFRTLPPTSLQIRIRQARTRVERRNLERIVGPRDPVELHNIRIQASGVAEKACNSAFVRIQDAASCGSEEVRDARAVLEARDAQRRDWGPCAQQGPCRGSLAPHRVKRRASSFFSQPPPPRLLSYPLLAFFLFLLPPAVTMSAHDNEELIDYEDEHDVVTNGAPAAAASNGAVSTTAPAGDSEGDKDKKNFSGIHSTGFRCVMLGLRYGWLRGFDTRRLDRDFLLKPELLRAISDLGFEHPSEGL